MNDIIVTFRKQETDEEAYQKAKRLYKIRPDVFINPEKWKERRLEELRKKGLIWRK